MPSAARRKWQTFLFVCHCCLVPSENKACKPPAPKQTRPRLHGHFGRCPSSHSRQPRCCCFFLIFNFLWGSRRLSRCDGPFCACRHPAVRGPVRVTVWRWAGARYGGLWHRGGGPIVTSGLGQSGRPTPILDLILARLEFRCCSSTTRLLRYQSLSLSFLKKIK
jgi:hypothetical protein